MKRKKKRPHDYVHKTPSQNSPADIMRSAYKKTKKILSVKRPHPNLARVMAIRQRWLVKREGGSHLPPGALIAQKDNVLAQYVSSKGPRGLRPISPSWWSIYAIVNLSNGRAYMLVVLHVARSYGFRNMSWMILAISDDPYGTTLTDL